MPRRSPLLAVLVLAGAALATSGCLGLPEPESEPARPAAGPSASRSPLPPPAKDDVVALLTKLMEAQYTYHVESNLPDEATGKVSATGGYDHAGQVFEEDVTVTGTGSTDGHRHRIVFGHDLYSRDKDSQTWVHLDLSRLKSQALDGVNMDNPTGLATFTKSVVSATASGPHAYKGLFAPMQSSEEFLPVGRPSVIAFYTKNAPFTLETDDQGNVTSIRVEMELQDKPTFVATTTFAGHGQALATKRPAKNKTAEADNMYYR
ncbi:hypothetical protein ABT369_50855 [Dactylosporangium sp. NPDC000244]|uniref:hypothetical protein n=1 Tax=Dactylosporangium sp. NPDC000244 TaxID=3154365 RepID=UPI00332E67A5